MAETPAEKTIRRYAEDVLGDYIVAGQWTKLACKRHLDDLVEGPHRDLRFNGQRAQHVVDFFSICKHVKGPLSGEPISLAPWQIFNIGNVFGWERPKEIVAGRWIWARRFTSVYWEVARKNAKSTMCAGLALYLLKNDGEKGADIYSAATSFDQAKIVFGVAADMLFENALLSRGLLVQAKSIIYPETRSRFIPLHAKVKGLEGLHPHASVVDELHAHSDARVWDVLEQGKGARAQPLIFAITTAGDDVAGICFEQNTLAKEMLMGNVVLDDFFANIYTIDPGDDWRDEKVWAKANPNLEYLVLLDDIRSEVAKAGAAPRRQATVKTKRLNVWVASLNAYFNLDFWDQCLNPEMKMADFADDECFMAVDAATERDITALITMFRRVTDQTRKESFAQRDENGAQMIGPDGKPVIVEIDTHITHYYIFVKFYLPTSSIDPDTNNPNAQLYRAWNEAGFLTLTPGSGTDYEYLKKDIREVNDSHHVVQIAFDMFQAHQMAMELEAEGMEAIKIPQNVMHLSEPMKKFDIYMEDGFLHHTGNPIMRWMVGNTVATEDINENVLPKKEKKGSHKKIDGTSAAIMALSRAIIHVQEVREEIIII